MSSDDTVFIPNCFHTPNVYVDEVMAHVSGAAYKILTTITRHTLGWHRDGAILRNGRQIGWLEKGVVTMGLDAIREITGLSRQTVIDGGQELKKLSLILVHRGPKNSRIPNGYSLNLDLTTGELVKKLDQSKKLTSPTSLKIRPLLVQKVDSLKTNINKDSKRDGTDAPHTLSANEEPKSAVDKQLLSDPAIPPHPKESQTRAPAGGDSRIRDFFGWWGTEYEIRFRVKYVFNGAKEGALIKRLPADYDLARLKDLARRFFESDDDWIKQHGGYTVGVFMSQLNKLASTDAANGGNRHGPPEAKDLGDGWLEVNGMKISQKDYERRWKTA